MKSKISLILMIALLFSCNIDFPKQSNVEFESLNEIQAKELAQNEVANIASSQTAKVWNSNSKVVSAFPVYLDGIDGISYYECKVTTNGQDSGYVLVNINNTDFPIVEACENGVTLNESYANSTGLEVGNFDVYRYGYLESVAYANEEGATLSSTNDKKERKVVGATGIDVENFDFNAFKKAVKKNNGSPYSTLSYEKESKLAARGMTGKGTASVAIKSGNFLGGVRTPKWSEFVINYKENKVHYGEEETVLYGPDVPIQYRYPPRNATIGNVSVVWSIVLAYWQVVHGKSNLFTENSKDVIIRKLEKNEEGIPISANYDDIILITRALGTIPNERGLGTNLSLDLVRINRYIGHKGYSCTVVHDNGGYDTKFNMIYDALAANNPVIMKIHGNGIGASNYYAVIEAAERQSVRTNSYIRYYCNMGHSDLPYKYVYAFHQKPIPKTINGVPAKRHSTYSFWYVTIN